MIKNINKTQERILKKILLKLHNKERVDMLQVIKAITFLLHAGCQWSQLPSRFLKYGIVYYHFRHLSDSNLLPGILDLITIMQNNLQVKMRGKEITFSRAFPGVFETVLRSRALSPLPHHTFKYAQGLLALTLNIY